MATETEKPISDLNSWFVDKMNRSDDELARLDIAETNLMCSVWLEPPTTLLPACRKKVDDWAEVVDRFTRQMSYVFDRDPKRFDGSEARFRSIALIECLQRHVGIRYNFAFAQGEYDASDPRDVFIYGLLMGFGGTCASLPVLCCAIGRRLGYPMGLGETREHVFCRWDAPDGESFCFDAAGKGCLIRDEDYYRHWPKAITANEEQLNSFIRRLTPREELAFIVNIRARCLMDRFHFTEANNTFYYAYQMAPHKVWLCDDRGLAHYSARIAGLAAKLRKKCPDIPLAVAVQMIADKITGPNAEDADFYRQAAADNVMRIIRNFNRRRNAATRDAAIENLTLQ